MTDAAKIVADFLSLVPAQRLARAEKALGIVFNSIVRNADFKYAKQTLDNEANAAWAVIEGQFVHAGKWESLPQDALEFERNLGLGMTYVRDAIAVSKKLAKTKVQHAMVDAMRATVAKVLPLAMAMEEVKKKVVKGRANAIPSGYIRSRENTGTCPVCFRNIKLTDDQKMVHHGYQRPGVGYIVGDCFTVNTHQPYELSAEGTKAFLAQVVIPMLERTEKNLAALKSGKVVKFNHTFTDYSAQKVGYKYPEKTVAVNKGDKAVYDGQHRVPAFDEMLEYAIQNTESDLRQIERDRAFYEEKASSWTVKPLPTMGSLVKDGK